MSKTRKDRPRQQIYDFVHHALPEVFFKNPERLLKSVKESGEEFLNYFWGKIGKYSKMELDNLKIKSELFENDTYDLIKI